MLTRKVFSFFTAAIAGAILVGSANAAPILSIDFGPGALQSGFIAQTSASVTHTTTAGDITVTSDGSFFNRGAATGASDDLRDDFTFKNNAPAGLLLTLSGPGITANTAYEIRFWSFDGNAGGKTHSQSYAGESGTTGSAGPIIYPDNTVDTADFNAFSAVGTFTADNSGALNIRLTDTILSGTNSPEPRLNGFELSTTVIPEPASLAMGLMGLTLIVARRRRA